MNSSRFQKLSLSHFILFLLSFLSCNGELTASKFLDLPINRQFHDGSGKNIKDLKIIAAGIRSKKIFVAEVQVYKLGLYISQEKDAQILKSLESDPKSVIDYSSPVPHNSFKKHDINSALVLKFLRGVGTDKVVDAIVDILHDESSSNDYKTSLNSFKNILTSCIGSKGTDKNEEIEFVYHDDAGIAIFFKGKFGGSVACKELRKRLIDIYTGPTSITPDVVKCLHERYLKSRAPGFNSTFSSSTHGLFATSSSFIKRF